MTEIGKHEGSHVYILDNTYRPRKIVLASNVDNGNQVTTPGFGHRGKFTFEGAAIGFTRKQTGLTPTCLRLLNRYCPKEPVKEPSGALQYVDIMNFLALNVTPGNIEDRIASYRQTKEGRIYQPIFVEISTLSTIKNLAPEIPRILERYF